MTVAGWAWLAPACVAAGVSFVVVVVLERMAPAVGLLDVPSRRSSHVRPRPRGGGIGIALGLAAGLMVSAWQGQALDPATWTVLLGAAAVAAVGLVDDLRDLSVAPRLSAQVLVSVAVIWTLGGLERLPLPAPLDLPLGWAGGPLAVVWLVGVVNFFNFMDGADGLAGGQAVISLGVLAWGLAPAPASVAAGTALAATAMFLLRNWSPARIFLGDVGSAGLGFLLAALPLAAPSGSREPFVLLAAISLALFLLDPAVTLVLRTVRGAPIGQAHREHAYQRLFRPGDAHAGVVSGLLLAAVVCAAAGVAGHLNPALGWGALGVAVVAFAIEWRVASRRPRPDQGEG